VVGPFAIAIVVVVAYCFEVMAYHLAFADSYVVVFLLDGIDLLDLLWCSSNYLYCNFLYDHHLSFYFLASLDCASDHCFT